MYLGRGTFGIDKHDRVRAKRFKLQNQSRMPVIDLQLKQSD